MKRLILLLSLMLASATLYAQQAYDVVYLNNGNIVKGEIISSTDSQVQIKATNGETYTFRMVEVRRIDNGEQLAITPEVGKSIRYTDFSESDKGYWASVDLGLGVALDKYNKNSTAPALPIDLNVTMGYRFNEFLMIGIGGGVRYYAIQDDLRFNHEMDNEDFAWAFPLYGQLRGAFISGKSRSVVPYWQFSAGHTFNDGLMLQPVLGLRFGTETRHHFTLALSYTAQQGWKYQGVETLKNGYLHLMQLKLGYQF